MDLSFEFEFDIFMLIAYDEATNMYGPFYFNETMSNGGVP